MHRTTSRFWDLFARLPEAVLRIARQNFELLKETPSHPSLHFKKIGKLWSVRVGLNHIALSPWTMPVIISGSGLVPTMTTFGGSNINLKGEMATPLEPAP